MLTGCNVIKLDAYGFGEVFDKTVKCEDRFHTFCEQELSKVTPKEEVKAGHECKGADSCRADRFQGAEICTSFLLGAKKLYCSTKFDPKIGIAIARGGFVFGEKFDKSFKCESKNDLCCYENLCN